MMKEALVRMSMEAEKKRDEGPKNQGHQKERGRWANVEANKRFETWLT